MYNTVGLFTEHPQYGNHILLSTPQHCVVINVKTNVITCRGVSAGKWFSEYLSRTAKKIPTYSLLGV